MGQVDIRIIRIEQAKRVESITPLDVTQIPPATQTRSTSVHDPSKTVVDCVGDETSSMS